MGGGGSLNRAFTLLSSKNSIVIIILGRCNFLLLVY